MEPEEDKRSVEEKDVRKSSDTSEESGGQIEE